MTIRTGIRIVITIAALALVASGCSLLGIGTRGSREVGASYIPAVLTGGAGYESAGQRSLGATDDAPATFVFDFPTEQWQEDYGTWEIVPKVSTYFNNLFVNTASNFDEGVVDAVAIDHPVYTIEGTFEGDDIVRVDDDGRNWERLFAMVDGGFSSYARYQQTDSLIRAMRVMFDIGGSGNHEILELYETERYKFVKVHWWSNAAPGAGAPPKLTHFVSVVDKNSASENATGRWMNENLADDDFTTHVFSFGPGTEADVDYHTYETGSTGISPSGDRAYGFFNNVDYYVTPTTAAPATSGEFAAYVHPDRLTTLFEQGFTPQMWEDLRTELRDGTDGLDFVDWDLSAFE